MDKSEINLKYNITKDNNKISLKKITSDLDNLSPLYDGILIINLIQDLFNKIFKDINKYTIGDAEYDKILELSDNYQNTIIQATLNYCYNIYANKTGCLNSLLEYSIAVYNSIMDEDKNDIANTLSYTAHSDNINMFEPMLGSTAFLMDIVDCMDNSNIPKDEIQKIIKALMYKHTNILLEYIDELDDENNKDD